MSESKLYVRSTGTEHRLVIRDLPTKFASPVNLA
jgi:hypothetical protein